MAVVSGVLPPGQRADLDQAHRKIGDLLDRLIALFRRDLAAGADPAEAVAVLTHRLMHAPGNVGTAAPGLLAVAIERLSREERT